MKNKEGKKFPLIFIKVYEKYLLKVLYFIENML